MTDHRIKDKDYWQKAFSCPRCGVRVTRIGKLCWNCQPTQSGNPEEILWGDLRRAAIVKAQALKNGKRLPIED